MTSTPLKIGFIGFGEASQAFAEGFQKDSAPVVFSAYDVKTNGTHREEKFEDYRRFSVKGMDAAIDACVDADLIFSLVTADQAENAARAVAEADLGASLFLDCNSCAPETKRRSAKRIEAAGGRYVDVAIMTPVHPRLHKAPCNLAGPHAEVARLSMNDLGMETKIIGDAVGDASVRKMVRSVMIKGLEALTLECFLAARKAGIEDELLTSLEGSFPGFNWEKRAPYMIERAMTHGIRRADEMAEVAQTLRDLDISPNMVEATVTRQREVGALGLDAETLGKDDLGALTDAIAAAVNQKKI